MANLVETLLVGGLTAGAAIGAWGLLRARPGGLSGAPFPRRRPRRGNFRGVGPEGPLQMAEFVIGQDVGEPIGHVYETPGRPACRIGQSLAAGTTRIPYKTAKGVFLRSRAHFLGGEEVGGAGATLLPAQGVWRDPVSGTVFDEPSFVGQVMWFGPNEHEPTPAVFRERMKKMCEDVACRLAQKEVLLRLHNGGRTTLTRCSARGKAAPV